MAVLRKSDDFLILTKYYVIIANKLVFLLLIKN